MGEHCIATMTERASCIATTWFPPRDEQSRSPISGGACAKICLWIPAFATMLLGQILEGSLHLLTVSPSPKGVVIAGAESIQSSPLPVRPRHWRPSARSDLRPSQEEATEDNTRACEASVASGVASCEAAWARSLCMSAGADDIQRCVRDTKLHPGLQAQGERMRAKTVGILAQHFRDHFRSASPQVQGDRFYDKDTSLLVASYVKYVEAGGHRVIPIPANASVHHYRELFMSIDGLLLPGGSAAVHSPETPYYRATKLFLDWAVQANESGRYFPVLGICLGFHAMILWGTGGNFTYFNSEDYRNLDRTRQLRFLPAANTSKLFGPERSDAAASPPSTERKSRSAREGETHRAHPPNFETSLEQVLLPGKMEGFPTGSKAREVQRLKCMKEAQENRPHTFKDDATTTAENLIDKTMLVNLLSRHETAYFHHTHRITRAEFERDPILSRRFALLATVAVTKNSGTVEGDSEEEFVAVVESTQYPFYGFQFHPEKSLFEHSPFSSIPHDAYSRWVANSLALFFATEVGKSTRIPTPFANEWLHYIERYTPADVSSREGLYIFEEVYFFGNVAESAPVHTTA